MAWGAWEFGQCSKYPRAREAFEVKELEAFAGAQSSRERVADPHDPYHTTV